MSSNSLFRGRRTWLWGVLAAAIVTVAGYAGYRWVVKATRREPDMVMVLRVNNWGVAHMDRFEYSRAVKEFEVVTTLAPDWLPGQINLGIALLNLPEIPGSIDRAVEIFQHILQREAKEPDHLEYLYARFCLGIIFDYRGNIEAAIPHFEAVVRKDPNDAASWSYLGKLSVYDDARALECFERAVKLNPYLRAAVYGMFDKLRATDPTRSEEFLKVHRALEEANWGDETGKKVRYSEMGPYAEVIGRADNAPPIAVGPLPLFVRDEKLQVRLADKARWATAEDLRGSTYGELRAAVRARFGATMVVLDYDRDDKLDLFLLGAVVENGQVRDLLLHNDGNGHFTDVTAKAGLSGARPSLGCCVADFDNDGYQDIFITGIGEQHLFRNNRKGGFEEVTRETGKDRGNSAGLDKLNTICLGATFFDLDQDGDLDLIVCQYAATPEQALAALKGTSTPAPGPGLAVYLNVGEAPANNPSVDPPPLKPRFRRMSELSDLSGVGGCTTSLVISDLELDGDLDVLTLADQVAPTAILNDRLLRFHKRALPEALVSGGLWNGGLVIDANLDGRSDLFLIGPGHSPALLLSKPAPGEGEVGKWFQTGATNSPPLIQALALDVDHDGWPDVVGLSEQRKPVLLHNDGQRLVHEPNAFGRDDGWPSDLISLAMLNIKGGKYQDLLVWSESGGLQAYANQGNGNNALMLVLSGHRRVEGPGSIVRCNADGIGTRVTAQADNLRTGVENTTLAAGLGQSRRPLLLGLGKATEADAVLVRWPDYCWQADLDVPTGQVFRVEENNRKRESCPILFTWDGERFVFVTDFLGAGTVGETQPDGSHRPPRPEESVKIEPHQLAPLDGRYVLKLAEPMDEVTYLDRLQLVVVDHPADMRVYPDERFSEASPPTQDLLAFRQEIFPVKARDHRGRDVTAKLRQWDRDTVRDFARRTWIGFAEEHWVELDFGDRLAKLGPNDRLVLCLAGWTDYPYPESIWAATQAGVPLVPPVLERLGDEGKWQTLIADAGFPAGLPRMMTVDVTGKLGGPRCVVRLRTSMTVYWDQIFVAPVIERIPAGATTPTGKERGVLRTTSLEVADATLSARGCMQEFSPDGREPTIFDYDRLAAVPVSRLAGRMTRYGDVTELLHDRDDCFVIFGPGDELTVRFDARKLPELPTGWKRSFVLRTWGYCKDCAPFTATGGTIEPLPFEKMSNYPYGTNEQYPNDRKHQEYLTEYQTRIVGPRDRAGHGRGR